MNESLRCPPGEKLRLLVLAPDQLDLAETQRLEAHVESCDDCKTKLESMDFLVQETAPPTPAGYELLEKLGEGGMGVVYQARELQLRRIVALKFLPGAGWGSRLRGRFRLEAEAVAGLQHPHIVQVFAVGEEQGCPFLAMEYVAGGTLAGKLAATPLPPQEAALLVETLARAVQHAHERNILHRDLKPANVLLTKEGTPKISDFGLAKKLDSEAGQTSFGAILGTPSYMAPEQAAGKGREVSQEADVYALGAILYEGLTGRPPFRGVTVLETLEQVRTQEPVPPVRLLPRCPRDLETICLKCLQKEPARRYPSAAALAEDLRRFQAGEPISARPVGRLERTLRWCRRNPLAAALAAVAIVAVTALAGVAVALGYNTRLQEAYDEAEGQRRLAVEQGKKASQAALEADQARAEEKKQREIADKLRGRTQYLADVRRARQFWEQNNFAALQTLLPALADSRTFESCYLQELDRRVRAPSAGWDTRQGGLTSLIFIPRSETLATASLTGDRKVVLWEGKGRDTGQGLRVESGAVSVAASADGKWFAAGFKDGSLIVYDTDRGTPVAVKAHNAAVMTLVFSADGRRLVSGSRDGSARLWDPTQVMRPLLTLVGNAGVGLTLAGVASVALAPDGKTVVLSRGDGSLSWYDLPGGKLRQSLFLGTPVLLASSTDGTRLIAAPMNDRGTLAVLDARTGAVLRQLDAHTRGITGLTLTEDGLLLATASKDLTVKVWDTATWQLLATHRGHTSAVTCVAFDDTGRLASGDEQGRVLIHPIQAGSEFDVLQRLPGLVQAVAFGPRSNLLATTGGYPARTPGLFDTNHWAEVNLWDTVTGRLHRALQQGPVSVGGVAFAPDGRTLVSGAGQASTGAGEAFLWDVAHNPLAGRPRRGLPGMAGMVNTVAVSPDGKLAVTGTGGLQTNHLAPMGEVKVWDLATGQLKTTLLRDSRFISALAFSPDGHLLAAAIVQLKGSPARSEVLFWDVSAKSKTFGKMLGRISGQEDHLVSLAFSPDSKMLATGSGDPLSPTRAGQLDLWDMTQLASAREPIAPGKLATLGTHGSLISALAFAPDGKTLASGSWDATARLWEMVAGDKPGGRERAILKGHKTWINALVFTPDGKTLLTGSGKLGAAAAASQIKVWDVATGKESDALVLPAPPGPVNCLALSRDGVTLAVGTIDGRLALLSPSPRGGKVQESVALQQGKQSVPDGHRYAVTCVAFDPDGKFLATGSLDRTVKLWAVATGKVEATMRVHAPVSVLAFAPDGKTLAVGTGGYLLDEKPGELNLFHVAPGTANFGKPRCPPCTVKPAGVSCLVFHPDGTKVLLGTTIARLDRERVVKSRLLTVEARSGKILETIEDAIDSGNEAEIRALAISRDGQTLALGTLRGTVRLRRAGETGFRIIGQHDKHVSTLAFEPEGKTLVSASYDSGIKLWHVEAGEELFALPRHTHSVWTAAFAPDGQTLCTAGWGEQGTGEVRLWRAPRR